MTPDQVLQEIEECMTSTDHPRECKCTETLIQFRQGPEGSRLDMICELLWDYGDQERETPEEVLMRILKENREFKKSRLSKVGFENGKTQNPSKQPCES